MNIRFGNVFNLDLNVEFNEQNPSIWIDRSVAIYVKLYVSVTYVACSISEESSLVPE